MPHFIIPKHHFEVPRNLALVDTNVLIAYHDTNDRLHEQAYEFVEAGGDYELLVAPPVIVEACGLLTSRRGSQITLRMLNWLLTPGKVILMPNPNSYKDFGLELADKIRWMDKFSLDYVDSYLIIAADYLTTTCRLTPPAPIITFDTGDFTRCALKGRRFSIYDMKNFELLDFNA